MSQQPVWLPEVHVVALPQDAQARLSLYVPAELEFFSGHFPGLPILPGVVLVHWATQLARAHLPAFADAPKGALQHLDNVKFLGVVRPGMKLDLSLEWDAERHRLSFKYAMQERVYASGRLAWAPTP